MRDKNVDTILKYLRDHDNFSTLNDKSDPALIQRELGISKAAFKKGIGALYKRRVIVLEEAGIRLLASDQS